MLRITVIGAAGRMGKQIISLIRDREGLRLVGAIEASGIAAIGEDAGIYAGVQPMGITIGEDLGSVAAGTDVIIDFSSPATVIRNVEIATEHNSGIVIGTTGLDEKDRDTLKSLSEGGARIVFAPNMSVGVNLLFVLAEQVSKTLGEEYHIEIVEMHHSEKKDAPSGTADQLLRVVASARGLDSKADARHGRAGIVGARSTAEIGVHSLRGGDVVGDHHVIFAGEGERIELTHRASSRVTFAAGALRAAEFIQGSGAGLYDMRDVLGL